MNTPVIQSQLTLEEFLKLPETKPASEFINGVINQKPMPEGQHSVFQGKLCAVILGVFPEQRVEYFEGTNPLPGLAGIDLTLTVEQVFSWLVFQ